MGRITIGQPLRREEDPRLLRGEGKFIDDLNLPDQAYGYVLRSPYAHARILAINTDAARRLPGVLKILTGANQKKAGIGSLQVEIPRKRRDGAPMFTTEQPPLAADKVTYVGDYVAFVVAETVAQAKDAAEAINVDYETLPAIVDTEATQTPGPPSVWEDCPDHEAFFHEVGDKATVDSVFAMAAHTVSQRFDINRVTSNAMETRGCIGEFDTETDRYVLNVGTQSPHGLRRRLARFIFGLEEDRFHIIASPDMGGGFGMKGGLYGEYPLVLWAAREIGRPVKWIGERSEAILSDSQARDNVTEAELALDTEGNFLAMRTKTTVNIGAHFSSDRMTIAAVTFLGMHTGTYVTPAIHSEVTAVFTNKAPCGPYRGAGKPEAAFVIERMVDLAAQKLGMDAAEIRRKNMIPAIAAPYETGFIYTYDSGEFGKIMDIALANADYENFESRRENSEARGKLRGIGISSIVESTDGTPPMESAEIRFEANGDLTLLMGTHNHGQGHETIFKQILSGSLGIDSERIKFVDGDTDLVKKGIGTFGSRSTITGGNAVRMVADQVIERCRRLASHLLEASEADIVFEDGRFTVAGTDRTVDIVETAKAAFDPENMPPDTDTGLYEMATFQNEAVTFPNCCHVCEVEVDPDTGKVTIVDYTVVDDVGTVINPLLQEGQVHGGLAQGVGQALMEDIVYDSETGQMLTGSFMDYCMPRADDFCSFNTASNNVVTGANPLGVKGAGETGTIGALPAVTNAVVNALAKYKITHIEMPATPERVWRAIRDAKEGKCLSP